MFDFTANNTQRTPPPERCSVIESDPIYTKSQIWLEGLSWSKTLKGIRWDANVLRAAANWLSVPVEKISGR
ncbi:hypothetical protein PROFUN_09855 [Planoprotostelium fungivorum]|uniref:Uncharacterized protein n=1 Tax=Planoprotostelium fungivorum TaxID=1890364 RepID=A0A2P6NFN4_9EUKA|nr:hypothetical protein PROFUN_09855 [Planoprotostelium fungivorum]